MNHIFEQNIKIESKKKKISKHKNTLLLLDESEEDLDEVNDDSNLIYTKRHLNLKNTFSETRSKVLSKYGSNNGNNNEEYEDVFDNNKTINKTNGEKSNKTNEELKELMDLVNEVRHERHEQSICDTNDNSVDLIVDSNDTNEDMNTSVSYNTRSKKNSKTKPKTKKTIKKKTKKTKNNSGIDENQIFEKLDVLECVEDIEVLEDIEEYEIKNISLNVSQDMEEYMHSRSIEIKVKYKSVIEKFSMKQNDEFLSIMPLIAQRCNEDLSALSLRLNDRIIAAESTPESIGLEVSDIIICHKRVGLQMNDPNILTLKLRDSSKVTEAISVSKYDKISKILDYYSKKKGLSSNSFRLEFDGERLHGNQTIGDCDIEDDSQIDVIFQ